MSKTPKSKELKVKLMLDSGIFTSWRRSEQMSLKNYIAYLKEYKHLIECYVTVDEIPGEILRDKDGRMTGVSKRTPEMVERSAKIGYKNTQVMKDAGLSPIPVFHQGESFKWLEQMLKDGDPHIGISSAKDLTAHENEKWLNEVFTVLTTQDGRPIVRTHGFGITKPAFVKRYPWATTDSTTWSLSPGYGRIAVPQRNWDGTPNFLNPKSVHISGVKQAWNPTQSGTFDGMGDMFQEWVRKFLADAGVTIAEARYFSNARRQAMLYFYLKFSEHMKDVRFPHRGRRALPGCKPIKVDFKMYFSTTFTNTAFSEILSKANANNRLLSYYEMKSRPGKDLEEYVMTGKWTPSRVIDQSRMKPDYNREAYRNRRRLEILQRGEEPEPNEQR